MATLKKDATEAEIAAFREAARAASRKHKANRTPEQRAEIKKQDAERHKAKRAAMSPDELEVIRARDRARRSDPATRATLAKRAVIRIREQKRGMPNALFEMLHVLQEGRCAVCERAFTATPHADHCHDTKQPRGLLCRDCNMLEGYIKRTGLSPTEIGERLRRYLADPPAKIAELV